MKMNIQNPRPNADKHVALFLSRLGVGGAERVTLELAGGFARRGFGVDLVAVNGAGPFRDEIPAGVRLVDLQARNAYTCFPKLVGYLRKERPPVFISTLVLTDLIAQLAGAWLRLFSRDGWRTRFFIRLATTISQLPRSYWKKPLEKVLVSWIYPWADEIIADSRGVAEDLQAYAGISFERVHLIYDPIITPAFKAQMHEPVEHAWFSKRASAPLILGMGRLSPEKDYPTLLQAFASLKELLSPKDAAPKLVILGDGPERARLEEMIRDLGLAEDVSLPGFVMNPGAYLARGRIFVLSSLFEGLPGALIQAMACGCALVATDCPSGPREVLDGGKYGHLVPVGDVQKIAEALQAVLEGDERKPPQAWLARFEEENVLRQYIALMRIGN